MIAEDAEQKQLFLMVSGPRILPEACVENTLDLLTVLSI